MCCGIYRAVDMYSNFSENHSYMIILSDGEVNYRCDGPGSYTGVLDLSPASAQSTVEAGQYACENNISVFVIAAGPDLEPEWTETLKEVACDESMYFETSDFSELSSIYENVTREILSRTTYTSQIVHPGEGLASNLTNSYITYHYESNINPLSINEIPITKRTSKLNYCNASVLLNPNLRVIESYITSYSDEHWTSLVGINDQTVFNISNYGSNFNLIGDPFIVGIPGDLFSHGNNSIAVLTGSAPGNETGCSPDNIIVLSTAVSIIPPISPVASKAEGCHWHVLQENLESFETSIPSYYSGSKNCYYHNSTYDIDDAYDISAYSLFSQLDIDNNGMIDIYLTEQALTVESIVVENVPSLWGPAIFEVKVGR